MGEIEEREEFEAGRQQGHAEGYQAAADVVRAIWRLLRPGDMSGGSAEDLLNNLPRWLEERDAASALEERCAARASNEEAQEIIAELSAALAVIHGEPLDPCTAPCPGHLGPKAGEAHREALKRWREMELRQETILGLEERCARLEAKLAAERGMNQQLAEGIRKLVAAKTDPRIAELQARNEHTHRSYKAALKVERVKRLKLKVKLAKVRLALEASTS